MLAGLSAGDATPEVLQGWGEPPPALCRAQRLLGDDDPHEEVDHNAGAPEQGQHHEQHSNQGRVGVEISGEAATHAGPSLRLVRLRYSLRIWAMAPPLARMPTLARMPAGQAGGLRSRLHRSMRPLHCPEASKSDAGASVQWWWLGRAPQSLARGRNGSLAISLRWLPSVYIFMSLYCSSCRFSMRKTIQRPSGE
jgi:hypothetical protein